MSGRLDPKKVAPDATHGLVEIARFVRSGPLPPSLLELVKVRASQMNACAYCLALHTDRARKFGVPQRQLDLLDAWRESTEFSPRERAALEWTEALTLVHRDQVPDAAWETVKSAFGEREIVDLTLAIVEINSWNRIQIAFRRPLDFADGGSSRGAANLPSGGTK